MKLFTVCLLHISEKKKSVSNLFIKIILVYKNPTGFGGKGLQKSHVTKQTTTNLKDKG